MVFAFITESSDSAGCFGQLLFRPSHDSCDFASQVLCWTSRLSVGCWQISSHRAAEGVDVTLPSRSTPGRASQVVAVADGAEGNHMIFTSASTAGLLK